MSDPQQPDYGALLKRSLVAIDQLKARLAAAEGAVSEPIAIIGMGCRFAQGVQTPQALWELLRRGVDAVTEVPASRWDVDRYYDPDPDAPGKSYSRWGSFIDNVDRFDADFFGVSPREAVNLDPQQRLLMEVTWEALENAALAPAALAGTQTAVYVGISTHDYAMRTMEAVGTRTADAYSASGSAHSMASGRLSYLLGLHGPNMAIDTACSSSLVAIHGAMRSLRLREADLALAGGVGLTLSPDGSILTSRARMMSFDGRCKTFDASADGYVRAEGCGMLVLKRLSDALRDGDRIDAVIRGAAINQDGRSSGLTAPNGAAQVAVIRAALANARLAPEDISYIEAHGTGTSLGDPIEIKALGEVFGDRPKDQALMVGSVKTNIGHAEGAAGVAGVIKVVLALQHRAIPPHLHLRRPNPLIPWDSLPVTVPTALVPWHVPEGRLRRAGVSSFGFSGTNAHLVIEEAPAVAPAAAVRRDGPELLVLSAQTRRALVDAAGRLAGVLQGEAAPALPDVAATLACGRSHFTERLAVLADSPQQACERLQAWADGPSEADRSPPAGVARGRAATGFPPEVVFMFTGQGAQYPGMARALYESEPAFRAALDECAALADPWLGRSLLSVLWPEPGAATSPLIDDTAYTQPALFAVEYALAQLWMSWGVTPAAVLGHSVGEYVAACVAGVFTLADGLRLIVQRARLMSELPRDGAMAAVFADETRVREALAGLDEQASIAAVNGPLNTVVSGRAEAVAAVLERLGAAGIESQRLNVSHAFHSPLMAPMLPAFEATVAEVPLAPPRLMLMSNLSGQRAGDEICTAGYWRRHVREPVRFADAIARLLDDGYTTFLEIGPTPTLSAMAQRCEGAQAAVWLPSLRKGRGEREVMLGSLGSLYALGQPVRWTALWPAGVDRHAVLPTYPFQRERYWQEFADTAPARALAGRDSGHPLLGSALSSAVRIFEARLGLATHPWLADHRIYDHTLFPATGFLELMQAAAAQVLGDRGAVSDFTIAEALVLPEQGQVDLQVVVTPAADGRHAAQVYSLAADASLPGDEPQRWRLHASATLASATADVPAPLDRAALVSACPQAVAPEEYYTRLATQEAHYGPAFRGIVEMHRGTREVLGRVVLPPGPAGEAGRYRVHPALLDACLQLVGGGLDWVAGSDVFVPVGLAQAQVWQAAVDAVWCHVQVHAAEPAGDSLRSDLHLFDDQGRAVATLRGLELRRVSREALRRASAGAGDTSWLFQIDWPVLPLPQRPRTEAPGRWLVLADAGGQADALVARLREAQAEVVVVRMASESGREPQAGECLVDPLDAEALRSVLAPADGQAWHAVVSMWTLDAGDGQTAAVTLPSRLPPIEAAQHRALAATLHLCQALHDTPTRLWMLTRGAQAVADSVPDLVQASIWALAGVVASELPALRCVRIDLDPAARADDRAQLFDLLWTPDDEDRVALRQGARRVARLVPGRLAAAEVTQQRLEIDERGMLENLRLRAVQREAPGPGQVEIRVLATGLNFRDVLNALGMYPGDPGPLGNECAGVVTAVGAGVDDLRPGDEVVAMVDRSFATWVVAPAALTVRKPASLSFNAAATIPVTFLTAEYSLRHLAAIRPGQRVLIHAVTGGVGMAAAQLALRAGAVVFGTAGTPAKRELARAMGVQHVSDSRSLAFVDDILAATAGEGVDMVLNSLAGEFIPASLGLIRRSGGHFVEIGKTGIWDPQTVAQRYPGVSYHRLYLGEVTAQRPHFVADMLRELLAEFDAGVLQPLPQRCWPLAQAEQAFRYMGQGLHTGKVVITQHHRPQVRADAAYLVTGGLGGLGLAAAGWLVDAGARHLVLLGRRPPSVAAEAQLAGWREQGVQVQVEQADVADAAALAAVLQRVDATGAPLRGIVHAAGLVDDAMLAQQDLARLARVMAPKVQGTWHLHALTLHRPLDFFVMYSSGAAILGSPGQANYAAANAFLDALAQMRRACGLAALSINWGSWSEVGMAADVDEQHRKRWAALGLQMIEPAQGTRMLGELIDGAESAQFAALPLVRSRLPAQVPPLLRELRPRPRVAAVAASAPDDILARLAQAVDTARPALLQQFLTGQVVRVLALGDAQRADPHRSLMDMGMDSLMAMELRNRIQAALQVQVSVADLLRGPSLQELAQQVLALMAPAAGATPAAQATGAVGATPAAWEEGEL